MKHETRLDARTVKTKETIREAFESMIMEMDYSDITITELTKRAGFHRKTFYLHYESIEGLFQELEDSIVQELEDLCRRRIGRGGLDSHAVISEFSALLEADRKLHQRLFCIDSYHFLIEHIRERSCGFCVAYCRDLFGATADELDAVTTFISNGILSVWRKWYIQGLNPAEEYQKNRLAHLHSMTTMLLENGRR
jgi:AcrR family transcriptional regulator